LRKSLDCLLRQSIDRLPDVAGVSGKDLSLQDTGAGSAQDKPNGNRAKSSHRGIQYIASANVIRNPFLFQFRPVPLAW